MIHFTDILTKGVAAIEITFLQQFADEHPFFAPAQLLLSAKKKMLHDPTYAAQYEKTKLHFTNQSWLQYQLSNIAPLKKKQIEESESLPNDSIQQMLPAEESLDNTAFLSEQTTTSDQSDNQLAAVSAILGEHLKKMQEQEAYSTDVTLLEREYKAFHTVDYFASQGIKVSNDLVAWQRGSYNVSTKTFANLQTQHETMREAPTDTTLRTTQSVPIVTETMAAIYIQQGRIAQAIEVYQKLVFFNPQKSVFFAKKIEALKQKQ